MSTLVRAVPTLLALGLFAGCIAPRTAPKTSPADLPDPEPRTSVSEPAQPVDSARAVETRELRAAVVPPEIEYIIPAPQPAPVPASVERQTRREQRRRTVPEEPTFDIPIADNATVRKWVDRYSTEHKISFEAGMRRSGKYMERFREIFAEEGVPRDLVHMAHVESGFKTSAYSRAHAKGIFQFISGTARNYGLRVDYWADERSDPEKSARAAARYMKRLYDEFDDWNLSLAAYNAGEGKVRRAISRSGSRDFWKLARSRHLRTETKNHVPAVLAATMIYKDPKRYGIDVEPEPPLHYDTIVVHGAADFKVLARCAGTDAETIRELNPGLRRNQTPPDGRMDLHVPFGSASQTLAALEQVPSNERVLHARYHIQRGDTLSTIARKHRVSVTAIQQTNGMGSKTMIRENRVLLIPTSAASLYANVPPAETIPAVTGQPLTYRVRRGDTLYSIARRYDTVPSSIAAASDIPVHGLLSVGQNVTVIPGVRSSPVARGTVQGESQGPASTPSVQHTVRRGDTLWRIASLYQTSIHALCALNGISQNAILHPGVKLTVGYR